MTDNIYGFVYIWRDRKHGRYYIGSHMGSLDDGYVCSSKTMRQAHKRRPHDFKRRILEYNTTNNVSDLYEQEYRWLNLIKDEELGSRYYNQKRNAWGISKERISQNSKAHWSDPDKKEKHRRGMSRSWSSERRATHSQKMKDKWKEEDFRNKLDRSESNRKAWANDYDRRKRQSQRAKDHVYSNDTKAQMSQSAKRRCTPEWSQQHAAFMRSKKI